MMIQTLILLSIIKISMGAWSRMQKLGLARGSVSFGNSVSVYDSVALIGIPNTDDLGSNSGNKVKQNYSSYLKALYFLMGIHQLRMLGV